VTMAMTFFVYIAMTLVNTPGVGDLNTVVDSFSPRLAVSVATRTRVQSFACVVL
jgi:hypothetical protein